jgi:hypothetical protein
LAVVLGGQLQVLLDFGGSSGLAGAACTSHLASLDKDVGVRIVNCLSDMITHTAAPVLQIMWSVMIANSAPGLTRIALLTL